MSKDLTVRVKQSDLDRWQDEIEKGRAAQRELFVMRELVSWLLENGRIVSVKRDGVAPKFPKRIAARKRGGGEGK